MRVAGVFLGCALLLPLAAMAEVAAAVDSHAEALRELVRASGTAAFVRVSFIRGVGETAMGAPELVACMGHHFEEADASALVGQAMLPYVPEDDARRLDVFFATDLGKQMADMMAVGDFKSIEALNGDLKKAFAKDPALQPSLSLMGNAMKLGMKNPELKSALVGMVVHDMLYECRDQMATALTSYMTQSMGQKSSAKP